MKKIISYLSVLVSTILIGILLYNVFNKEEIENSYDFSLYIEAINEESISNGSGFVYKIENNKSYIVTSYHIIEGYNDVYIYNGNKIFKANIINFDEYTDIAVLTIENDLKIKKINIGNSDNIKIHDEVYVVGTPNDINYFNTVKSGKVTFVDKEIIIKTTNGNSKLNAIQTDINVQKGNSGSALLNKGNQVIGMIFIKDDDVSYALPINFIMDIAGKLEKNEVIRPNLGAVMCNSTNTKVLNEYNIVIDDITGVVLLEISESYPLYNAGLQKGDIITKFNNKDINNVTELRYELYKNKLGSFVDIEYYRNGSYYIVNIKL